MRKNVLICLFTILFLWLIVVSIATFSANNNSTNSQTITEYKVSGFSTDFSEVIEACKSSIVAVEQMGNVSSGFIYKSENDIVYIVTSFHGVSESNDVSLTFNSGAKANGKVLGYDIFTDIAIIECDFPYVVNVSKIGDSTLLKDGEFILSIGTNGSLDYAFTSKFAMVSSRYIEVLNHITFNEKDYEYYLGVEQLSGDITKGYSGAPVLNMNGEVVGMITMEDEDKVLSLTSDELKTVADRIIDSSDYTRINFGFRGKYICDLENYEVNSLNINIELTSGYYVSDVLPLSFAANVGILKNDVILKINDIEINDYDSMLNLIYSEASKYTFDILRDNESIRLIGTISNA